MQQVPELVKNRLGFAMRQQRRLAIHGRRQISANQTEIRTTDIHIPVISESIHAPPRLFSRGYQSA